MVKVIGLDPGKQRDSFGIVAIEKKDGKVYVKNAQRILGKRYIEVEDYIAELHSKYKYDYYILEVNNTGEHVFEVLKDIKKIPVIPVFTTSDVKDLKKKMDGRTMDKKDMVKRMAHQFQNNEIIFPRKSNGELDQLKRQLAIFSEHITEAGNVSYYAEGTEHDDLVMALMLACWYVKEHGLKIIKV